MKKIKLKTGPKGRDFSGKEKKRSYEIEEGFLFLALKKRYESLMKNEDGCDLYEATTLLNWVRDLEK